MPKKNAKKAAKRVARRAKASALELATPHFQLGSSFASGVNTLKAIGDVDERTDEKEGHFARLDTANYSVMIYEVGGRICSVWYDDPAGNDTEDGLGKKIMLYMARYTLNGKWKHTLDNGYTLWWHNEEDKRTFVYGLHAGVISVTDRRDYGKPKQKRRGAS